MREILFRGKSVNDGEWYFGSLVIDTLDPVDSVPFKHYHIDQMTIGCFPDEYQAGFSETVDPETVGQFTGLTDKNGKKIFEGDIVHVLGNQQVEDWKNVNYIGSIAFLDAGFCVIDGTIEDHAFRRYQLPRLDFDLEVIGNIHDNPELLEVTDNA